MHNPERAAIELSEKLSPRGRHVVLLIGAGASCAAGLPDVAGLQAAVGDALDQPNRILYERILRGRNIEQALTQLRLIAEAVRGTDAMVEELTSAEATRMDRIICAAIARVIAAKANVSPAHSDWARWASRARQDEPLEVFTTNYDLLLESALEGVSAPYFDGFVGIYDGRFRPDLVDNMAPTPSLFPPSRWIRLWKLHGSISWVRLEDPAPGVVVRRAAAPDPTGTIPLAIFPSLQKYDESRRTPFVVLADRLRRSLAFPETLCVTIGYNFGDAHINEVLYDAVTLQPASEIVALFRSAAPAPVTEKARSIPNLTILEAAGATIGGQTMDWQAPHADSGYWRDAKFTLGDFGSLARFLLLSLGRSEPQQPEIQNPA